MVSAIRADDERTLTPQPRRSRRAVAERACFVQEAVLRARLRAPGGYDDCTLYVWFAP